MESEVKVSIIVPVYNAEKYLNFTVDSLLNQTFRNIEVILVNDGSHDGSLELCKNYAKQDNRVKVIDKSNGGVSSARNCGIENAKGEFIVFVDSDDFIEKDACEKLYANAVSTGAEIVFCNYTTKTIFGEQQKSTLKNHGYGNCVINQQEEIFNLAQKLAFSKFCFHGASVIWAKIFKRQFLLANSVYFDLGRQHGEDWYFMMDVLCRATKISFINDFLYVYTFYKDLKKEFLRDKINQVSFTELLDKFEKFKNRFPQFDYKSKEYYEFCYRGIFNLQVDIHLNVKSKSKKKALKEIGNNDIYNEICNALCLSKRKEKIKILGKIIIYKIKRLMKSL